MFPLRNCHRLLRHICSIRQFSRPQYQSLPRGKNLFLTNDLNRRNNSLFRSGDALPFLGEINKKECYLELYQQIKDRTFAWSDFFEFNDTAKIDIKGQSLSGGSALMPPVTERALQIENRVDGEEAYYGPSMALQAVNSGLTSRGVGLQDLSPGDWAVFETAAAQITGILNSDVETSDQVVDLFGDELNITLVDGFSSLDGTALDGAAVVDTDEIILDNGLEGEDLRAALAEEVAETAYQEIFGDVSAGDFGAEVLARIEGLQDGDLLAEFSTADETDTVETTFGTAEAALSDTIDAIYLLSGVLGEDSVIYSDSMIVEDISGLGREAFAESIDAIYNAAGLPDSNFVIRSPDFLQNFFGETLQNEADNADLSPYTIPDGSGTEYIFDFDDDGNPTTSIHLYVDNYTDAASVQLVDRENTVLTPVDGLTAQTFTSEGSARFAENVSTGESYTTGSSWTVSANVGGATGSVVTGYGAAFDFSGSYGQDKSNTITAAEDINLAYTVDGSNYEAGTDVTFGLFGEIADATYTNRYDIYIATLDSNGVEEGGFMKYSVADTQLIDDHLINLVLSEGLTEDFLF